MQSFIPVKQRSETNHLPWMTYKLKRQIRKKQRTYNRAKKYNRPSDWKAYKIIQKQVQNALRQQQLKYLTDSLKKDDSSKKSFWRFIKCQKQDSTGISMLQTSTNNVSTAPEIAETLNNQFKSVFTTEDIYSIPDMPESPYPPITDINITTPGVYKLLSEIDPHKAPGPDTLPGYFLKCTATEIAPILTHMFQQSLSTGDIPSQWKMAYVTPIHKSGRKSDPQNYRPVSLTSIICKILEHILTSHIMKHLEINDILLPSQFGFRAGHSCEAQLLIATDDFAKALNNRQQVDIGILDLSKAFDRVPHARLLRKLHFYGIRGQLLTWLQSFLSERLQQVLVDGCCSSPCNVSSGVPQGSVLGPVLFLLYINDIAEGICSHIKLFADDCLIYRTIQSSSDQHILQQDLNALVKWAEKWQMKFNTAKCKIMQMTNHHNKLLFTYKMYGSPLVTTEQHSYLGVQLHHKLSWQPQIQYTCNKASKILGFLQRNLRHCPVDLRQLAYKQFVLPILEYCAPIWDPYHQKYIRQIEMVQHRAARFVLGKPWRRCERDSITNMLNQLNWTTLEKRRKYARLTLLYKILHKLICIPESYLPQLSTSRTRCHHEFKFLHYQTNVDSYKYACFPRTVLDWNDLTENIVNSSTLETFKLKLYSN